MRGLFSYSSADSGDATPAIQTVLTSCLVRIPRLALARKSAPFDKGVYGA